MYSQYSYRYDPYASYAFFSGFSTVTTLIALAMMIISIVAMWKILEKANEPGWKSLIPVYNVYMLFRIAWKPGMFWVMLGLSIGAPLLTMLMFLEEAMLAIEPLLALAAVIAVMVIVIILNVKLAKAFGQPGVFAVGLILLGFIFQCILAFGSAEYIGPQA